VSELPSAKKLQSTPTAAESLSPAMVPFKADLPFLVSSYGISDKSSNSVHVQTRDQLARGTHWILRQARVRVVAEEDRLPSRLEERQVPSWLFSASCPL
jgi:hypothetical protein